MTEKPKESVKFFETGTKMESPFRTDCVSWETWKEEGKVDDPLRFTEGVGGTKRTSHKVVI